MVTADAQCVIPTEDLQADITFFTKVLNMRMDTIYPADDPKVAVFSGYGISICIDKDAIGSPASINLLVDAPEKFASGKIELTAPNGTQFKVLQKNPPLILPKTQHEFVVRRLVDQAPWIIGRAGMHYRDLIPNRLGGSIIASHIRIPDGGPVPDTVHYHTVGFQLIFCYKGWVDLVYEDQGESFRLFAGNCVIQPPEIRHKVLYASDNIEVIEIGVPAEHVTTIDHDMELPTKEFNPEREFQGQKFVHNKAEASKWSEFRIPGFTCRDTTIAKNTQNIAGVQVVRPNGANIKPSSHNCDILFNFVMEGEMTLTASKQRPNELTSGDAFVIPPNILTEYSNVSADLELLEVSLPGEFTTYYDT
jgi:quercetin dioxygenase-like cupin family protein